MKKLLAMVLVFILIITLVACGGQNVGNNKAKEVKLTYYIVGSEQKDLKLVNDEINKITKDKINATVQLKSLDWGAYDQKMNMIIGSDEEFDLCFTAPQFNDYYTNIAREAFLPLDDLLTKYAPETKKSVDNKFWNAAKINGKIYGIINYQMMATAYGMRVQIPIADKSGIDYKNITKYQEMQPMLRFIKENYPEKVTLAYNKNGEPFTSALPMFGFDAIGSSKVPGVVRLNDKELKVVNQYDTPEFKEFIMTMRNWYNEGYIKKDAATSEEFIADQKAGKNAIEFPAYILLDTTEYDDLEARKVADFPQYSKRFTQGIIGTDRALATMTAISSTSKNPERAMMFIELINTNKELYNLLCWGIEGKHYTKVDIKRPSGLKTTIEPNKTGGYYPNTHWEFGNTLNLELSQADEDPSLWETANKNALIPETFGFAFDASSVSNEVAKTTAVITEYLTSLTSGSVEIDGRYKEFLEKLKTAGMDKIVNEKQKQLDSWKSKK